MAEKKSETLGTDSLLPFEQGAERINPGDAFESLFGALDSDPELARDFGEEQPGARDRDPDEEGESSRSGDDDEDRGEVDDDLLDLAEDDEEDQDDPGDGDESDDDSEGERDDDDDGEDLYEVVSDGKTRRVSLQELKDGWSRTQVFTERTTEAARIKREAEAEVAQTREMRAQYVRQLEKLEAAMAEQIGPEPDWDALRREDPTKFAVEFADFQRKKEAQNRVKAEKQAEHDRLREEEATLYARHIETEYERLLEAIPEWKDDSVRKAQQAELVQYAQTTYGYTREQLDAVADHNLLLILRKAMEFDRREQRGRDKVDKAKEKVKRKMPSGGRDRRPSTKQSKTARAQQRKLRDRLNRTGDPVVGRALLETMLED